MRFLEWINFYKSYFTLILQSFSTKHKVMKMKNLYHIPVYIWMFMTTCFFGANTFAQDHFLPDSLITDDYVYEYTFSDFDKAERIMQELRKRKTLPDYRLDVTEGDLYYNRGYFYRAMKFYKRALDNDSIRLDDTRFMEQIHRMISLYDYLHNDVLKAQYVDILLKKAEQCNNKEMKSVALFNMGKMLYFQGNKDKGYELMEQATELMEQTDYKLKYDNLRYNYNALLMFLQLDRRFEKALTVLNALQKVVTQETGNETSIEGLDEKEKKTMYAQYAAVLVGLKRMQEADDYYRRFLALAKKNDYDNYFIVSYLFNRGLYDDVISLNLAREKQLATEGDTVTYHMTTVKKFLGRAYEEKGNFRAATRYFRELSVLRDSIKNREQKSTALELAALYETHEKDMIIQKQNSDASIRNFWLWLTASIAILLGGILCFGIHFYRKIQFKNKALVKGINELLQYKKELYLTKDANFALQQQVHQLTSTLNILQPQKEKQTLEETDENTVTISKRIKEESEVNAEPEVDADEANGNMDPEAGDNEETELGTEAGDERYGKELYERMEHLIINGQLYLDPKFSGEKARKLVGIPRNRFTPFIKRYTGNRFLKYINKIRLYHAARLLQEMPDYSIEAIAKESGIPALTSFHRLFLAEFGVTPMEYRKNTKRTDI